MLSGMRRTGEQGVPLPSTASFTGRIEHKNRAWTTKHDLVAGVPCPGAAAPTKCLNHCFPPSCTSDLVLLLHQHCTSVH